MLAMLLSHDCVCVCVRVCVCAHTPLSGQLDLAKGHFEVFYRLSQERPWWDATGRTLQQCACEGLCAVYTQLAQGALQSQEYELAIEILNKAFSIAKEGR